MSTKSKRRVARRHNEVLSEGLSTEEIAGALVVALLSALTFGVIDDVQS